MTRILVHLKEGISHDKNIIVKYVEDVCTDKFEFITELLADVTREGAQRSEQMFVKRMRRAVVISRLLENMAVVYVGLAICF